MLDMARQKKAGRLLPAIKLEQWRTKAGWSQTELADRLSVTGTTVWRWENGERAPSLARVDQIAALFGVPVRRLYDDPDKLSIDELLSDASPDVRERVMSTAIHELSKPRKH